MSLSQPSPDGHEPRALHRVPSPVPVPAASNDSDLQSSLISLSLLQTGDGQPGFEDLLHNIAALAVRAVPGANGAAVALHEADSPATTVSTSSFVREIEALQDSVLEGPRFTAVSSRRSASSGALGREPEWPRFGARVVRLGVHSALSLPLIAGTRVLGAIDLYAFSGDAFGPHAAQVGELYSIPAAMVARNGRMLADAHRLVSQLEVALTSRAVIDQALGILMSRGGCTADEAFDKLRVISQSENRRLALIAQRVVDEAIRRARARRSTD